MNLTATVNRELLPGYEVAEQIGSGGYGEVFRAVAPGGIEKAVKVLHGYFGDDCAARELKALQRVKELRHPFLLSLERFEVVEGRLVVVTELADGSLDDVFLAYRRAGEPGIDRDELLDYLRDAADALDYMQQQHGLQHLDVKPENLLVVGGHVKVADFGLVKNVARATRNSLMGGMTPTYAAPELFDNAPGPRSDQYSLAIVFQELLTGTLPFPGQTAAQLVAQHTQSVPLTAALPEPDQPIVMRALAKDPLKRYGSCLELINALRQAASPTPEETSHGGVAHDGWPALVNPADDTKETASHLTQVIAADGASPAALTQPPEDREAPPPTATESTEPAVRSRRPPPHSMPLRRCKPASAPAEPAVLQVSANHEIIDAPLPPWDADAVQVRPTLLIGVGGQGMAVLERLSEQLAASDPQANWRQYVAMFCVDTDRHAIRALQATASPIESCVLPLKLPQHYRNRSSGILNWLSRRWFYNIPRSLETGGFRPLGRLALIDNADTVLGQLEPLLEQLTTWQQERSQAPEIAGDNRPPHVVLIASTSGGTGSGTAVDLAWAIRNWAAEKCSAVEVTGIFGDAYSGGCDGRDLAQVNTLAFLREFSSIARQGNASQDGSHESAARFEGAGSPFQHAYFVGAGRSQGRISVEGWVEQIALYLEADVTGKAAGLLDACRRLPDDDLPDDASTDRLRTLTATPLDQQRESIVQAARQRLSLLATSTWSRRRPHSDDSLDETESKRQKLRPFHFERRSDANAARKQLAVTLRKAVELEFGDAQATVFAVQLLAVLGEHLDEVGRRCPTPDTPGVKDPLLQLVRYALQQYTEAINDVRAAALAEAPLSARCLKSAELPEQVDPAAELSEDAVELAAEVAQQASVNYLTALAIGQKPWILSLKTSLDHAVEKQIDKLRRVPEGMRLLEELAGYEADLTALIEQTDGVLPGVGYERRSIVLFGEGSVPDALEAEVKKVLPTAAIVHCPTDRPLLIREGQRLSLAQLAATLSKDRPDLWKAACRLQTRNDVEWLPLPVVDVPVEG